MTSTNEKIGRRIKELRLKANLTQKDVVVRLKELGFTTGYVTLSNYENGKYTVPTDLLVAISQVLGCTVADITGYVVDDPMSLVLALRSAADLIEDQQKEISRLKETSCR